MADQITEPPPETPTPDPAPQPEPETEGFDALPEATQAEIRQLRKENAAARVAANEAAEKARKYDEQELAKKPQIEQLEARATAAEKRAAEAESKLLRAEAAKQSGLPAELAERLKGDTLEEMLTDAAELAKVLPTSAGQEPASRITPALRPGGAGVDIVEEMDPAKLAAMIPR